MTILLSAPTEYYQPASLRGNVFIHTICILGGKKRQEVIKYYYAPSLKKDKKGCASLKVENCFNYVDI